MHMDGDHRHTTGPQIYRRFHAVKVLGYGVDSVSPRTELAAPIEHAISDALFHDNAKPIYVRINAQQKPPTVGDGCAAVG
jgi:hypothetical protein